MSNFRRHPERIFQWAENRSVPAENNMSERGVRRTVIARKVCVRWTRASASLTCSSRCRHTRQNSVGDGRGPVAFTKAGRSRICLSDNGKILKADCGFGLDDSKSSDALLLRYSVAEVGHDRAVLTDRVRPNDSQIPLKSVITKRNSDISELEKSCLRKNGCLAGTRTPTSRIRICGATITPRGNLALTFRTGGVDGARTRNPRIDSPVR